MDITNRNVYIYIYPPTDINNKMQFVTVPQTPAYFGTEVRTKGLTQQRHIS